MGVDPDEGLQGSGGEVRTFYRAVRTLETSVDDFKSNKALNRPPRGMELKDRRLWEGLSVDTDPAVVANKAERFNLGDFVAELVIPEGAPVRFEKTLGGTHYTLWGEPEAIRTCRTSVVPRASFLHR